MIVIVDYGMGNLRSIQSKLQMVQFESEISSSPEVILKATKLILPGVGHFGSGMKNLHDLGLLPALNEAVLTNKTPILGICLGMQLLATHSEEGDAKGLGWLQANVVRFKQGKLPVPHVGWNFLNRRKAHFLFNDIPEGKPYYFTHSYYWDAKESGDVVATTEYGQEFVSVVSKGNIHGTQFHPEKSRMHGLKMLENFARSA